MHVRRRYIPAKEAVPEEPWEIDGSVWTPRKKWADSKDYYDTPTCLAKVLDADWAMARYGGGLERLVMRSDSSGEKSVEAVMASVRNVLWEHHATLYPLFDAYACIGGGDFTQIQLNGYKSMLTDCGLVDASNQGRWDELFVTINSSKSSAVAVDAYNHKKSLNRQEFVSFIVRAADIRHAGRLGSMAAAVEELLTVDMFPKVRAADPGALASANHFRRSHCYTEAVSAVLARHAESLKLLYEYYSVGQGIAGNAFEDAKLLGCDSHSAALEPFCSRLYTLQSHPLAVCQAQPAITLPPSSVTQHMASLL